MSILMWRILCLVSAVLFITGVIVLFATNLTKNKYYHNYHDDELLKKERTTNSVNKIFLTSGTTKRYIKKYVVCKSAYEKYLVCNFTELFSSITFFVVQFTRRKKVLSVLEVTQKDLVDTASKIIALKRTCARVNVVVGTVNGLEINKNYVRPISLFRLRLYAFIKAFTIFTALFVLRHVAVEILGSSLIFGRDVVMQYLGATLNYIAIGVSFLLAVLSYLITVACYRRKNNKNLNGGSLEYEFV